MKVLRYCRTVAFGHRHRRGLLRPPESGPDGSREAKKATANLRSLLLKRCTVAAPVPNHGTGRAVHKESVRYFGSCEEANGGVCVVVLRLVARQVPLNTSARSSLGDTPQSRPEASRSTNTEKHRRNPPSSRIGFAEVLVRELWALGETLRERDRELGACAERLDEVVGDANTERSRQVRVCACACFTNLIDRGKALCVLH